MIRRTAFVLLLVVVATAICLAEDFRPSPPFTGTALPVPPQQQTPWQSSVNIVAPNDLHPFEASISHLQHRHHIAWDVTVCRLSLLIGEIDTRVPDL